MVQAISDRGEDLIFGVSKMFEKLQAGIDQCVEGYIGSFGDQSE